MTDEEKRQLYESYINQGMTRIDAILKVLAMERLPELLAGLKREGVI